MLIGKKIILDRIEEKHLPQILKWRNNPHNRQWYREHRILTLEHQKKWWQEKIINGDGSWNYFVIKPINEMDCIIGTTGLIYINPVHRSGEVAFQIGDNRYSAVDKDYDKDILNTLFKFGFNDLNLNRLWIETIEGNPNFNLFSELNFKEEGRLRQTYFKNGKFKDSIIMSLLRDEWEILNKEL